MAKKYWWEDENQQDTQKSEAKSHWWEDSSVSSTVGTNITNRVNTWLKNHNTYISNYQTRNSGRKYNYEDSYVSDSADWLNTVSQQKSAFDAEADSILSYMDQYKDYLDADWMAQVRKTLTEARSAQDIVLGNTKKDNEWWRSFGSEEMLKAHGSAEEAYKANQRYDGYSKKYSGRKYEDIQKALKSFETNRSSEIAVMESDLSLYKELSRWEQDEKGQAKLQQLRQKYGSIDDLEKTIYEKKMAAPSEEEQWLTAYQDELYKGDSNYMSKAASGWKSYEAQKIAEWKEEESKTWFDKALESFATTPADTSLPNAGLINAQVAYANDTTYREPNDEWSTEQKNRFGYLWTEDKQKAYAYAEQVNNQINAKKKYDQQQAIGAAASDNFWSGVGHTLGAIVTAPTGIVDYLDDIAEYTARGTITQKEFVSPFEYSQAAQSGIANKLNGVDENGVAQNVLDENIPIFGGKGWGDIYSLGVSTANSMLSALAFGGAGTLVNFIGQGGAAGVDDALSRGATAEQALLYGTIVGSLEGLTEMIPAEQLIKAGSSATFKNWLKKALQQGAGEFFEEGSSSFFGNLADDIIMRDKSNYNLMVKQLMQSNPGMTAEEASKIAFKQMAGDIAYDAIGGAVSGFVSGGITGAVATAIDSSNLLNKENVKAKQQYGGSTDALIQEGLQNNPNSESYQLAQKYQKQVEGKKSKDGKEVKKGKELSGFQIRNLLAANQEQTVEQTKSRAKDRLKELGENASEIYKIADIVTKKVYGQELTRSEKSTLANSFGSQVAKEIDDSRKLAAELIKRAREASTAHKSLTDRVGEESNLSVSESGQTTIRGTDEAFDIKKAEVATLADGRLTFKTESGTEVSAEDIDWADEDTAYLVSAVSRIENITPGDATVLIHNYDASSNMSVGEYVNGIDEAFTYGYNNYSVEDMKAGRFTTKLSDQQMMSAYKLGQTERNVSKTAKVEAIKRMRTAVDAEVEKIIAEGKTVSKGKMTITYNAGNGKVVDFDQAGMKLSTKQKAAPALAKVMHEMGLGTNFELFSSYLSKTMKDEDGNRVRVFLNENGEEEVAYSGVYRMEDGTVRIDLNAYNGRGLTLDAMSHELTHFIQQWSGEKYEILADFLVKTYEKTDMSMHQRVLREQARLERIRKKDVSYSEAYDEVVANAMSKMLADGKVMERLNELKAQDMDLAQKLWEGLKKLLKKFFRAYEKESALFYDAADLMELKEEFEQMQKMWADAFVEASENFQANLMAIEVGVEPVAVEDISRYSYSSLAEAAGFVAVQNEDGTRSFTRDGNKVSEVTVEDIDNSPIGAFINFSVEMKDISEADAKRQKQMFADICTMACKTNDFAMTMQFVGSAVFTGMKANADKQYGTTYDFPSICTKTQAVIDAMSAKMMKLGRGLNTNEIVQLYDDVFASGNPVPCPECYVFSRWIGIGGLLDNIKKYQDYYGDMAVKDVADAYLKMKAEVSKFADEQGISFGKAKGALTSKLTKEFNKLTEKIEKAQNQGEKVKPADKQRLAELEPMMNTVKAMTWLENMYFADSSLKKVNPKFRVPNEVLFDLNNGEAFATQYKDAWAFRTTQGAGYGKAITPYAEARLGEGVLVTNNTTNAIKGRAQGTLNNYFLNQKGKLDKQSRDALKRARMKQKIQAFLGGQRFQSTSDARYENASDYLLAALEMQAMGGMVQCYTKVDGAIPAFSAWGFSSNQSLMPLNGGLDADGNVQDTPVGGMKPSVAFDNRKKHESAGTITIGVNDNHIRAMFKQWVRDFIIPYHASGGKADVVAEFRRIQEGKDAKGESVRSTDYSRTQGDKVLSDEVLRWQGKTDAQIQRIHEVRAARIAILTGGKPNMTVVRSNRFLSALYDKFNGGEWDGVKVAKSKVESQIFPNEFWDQTVSYDESAKITKDYLEYCEDLGFLHRFSGTVPSNGMLVPVRGYDQNGNRVQLTDLAYKYDENGNKTAEVEEFFWKVLTDRRMYDNNGNYLPQKVVTLNDTTTETVTGFAKHNQGRQYDKAKAEALAKKIVKGERYSSQETDADNAPTFYSQMGKVVEGMKQEKFGASSVISMLRGRGVKAEEIRWSGIQAFLDGKKSVTKSELLEFIKGSMLHIEEQVRGKPQYTEKEQKNLEQAETDLFNLIDKVADCWQIIYGTEMPLGVVATDGTLYGAIKRQIRNARTRPDISEIMEDADRLKAHEDAIRELNRTLASIREVEDIRDEIVARAEGRNKVEWEEYRLPGGENYREILFKMPGSTYRNQAMEAHWGDRVKGVLAHARMQDFDVDGKKMLFIEEIQSDWHNEGARRGYGDLDAEKARVDAEYDERLVDLAKWQDKLDAYNERSQAGEYIEDYYDVYDAYMSASARVEASERLIRHMQRGIYHVAPDAPFKSNYHEYVLKRLLRMAAEEGYDSIGWTTAQIQSDRWSSEYAEGYRIEYDQDMPKFLKKYGKQWGATVGKTDIHTKQLSQKQEADILFMADILEDSDDYIRHEMGIKEVWSMDITPAMKESVLTEGQALYSSQETDLDSKGKQLAKEQVEFFKDSMVRDRNGRLLVVYHGGTVEYVFDTTRGGNGSTQYGPGAYFTDSEYYAREYTYYRGGDVKPYYLNIEKLFDDTDMDATARMPQWKKLEQILRSNGIEEKFIKRFAEGGFAYMSRYLALKADAKTSDSWAGSEQLNAMLREAGYQGIKGTFNDVHQFVVFNPEQAKLTTNKKPTADKDIRFSTQQTDNITNRHLLANAFEGLSRSSAEYQMIQDYKEQIKVLNLLDEQLSDLNAEIREIRFTKGKYDAEKLRKIEEKAERIARDIDKQDKVLIRMEASEPLRKIIAFERKKAAQKAKDHVNEIQQNKKVRAEQTELRHKIRKAIRDLDKILKHGNKQKNVKEDLLPVVTKALQSADILFTDNYGTYDMLRNGIGADLSDAEEALVDACTRMLKDLDKMPTDGYDNFQARQEAERKLSYKMSNLKDVFARERKRLNSIKVSTILGELADAYASLEKSEQSYVQGAYTEAVHNFLKNLQSEVGGTIVKDMTKDQLEYVYTAYKMVLTTVRKANEMFNKELKMSREQLGNAVIQEVMNAGGVHGLWTKAEVAASRADWNNMKPIWVANRIGSETFGKLMQGLFQGQYNFAVDVEEAKQFKLSMDEKYKPRSWDAEKLYEFESSTGKKFSLNLQQIMSLYAFSKREQAYSHLLNGGFVFEGNSTVIVDENGRKKTYIHNGATSYKLNEATLNEIISSLTKEQKAYVDEMQKYLSEVMGAKGNEVSMQLYGIKMFKEQFYFPLRSSGAYMERAKEAEMKKQQGQINLVNSGFTHAVKPEAKNPIILSGFMDVWAEHCNEMSMYHSMVLPMEDFRKVYNYSTVHDDKVDSASVYQTIQDAYGDAATAYIDQLYRELNAGATIDPRETTFKKLISNFKKTAVMLSASVVVQQFSSIGRAYSLIDPKYFIGTRVNSDTQLSVAEEMRKYAPVAIIKEMGGFDTGTKGSAKSYIMAEKYGKGEWLQGLKKDEQYRSDLMGILPAKADEKTWCAIWEAVKRETKAKYPKMDVKSEEFLKLAGDRFSEVIEKTQVYDSVLARSANMRSKTGLMQMATSFMAEPTTTVNLLEDAIRRGDKKHMARVFGAVAVSIVLNNALASIVYAMRDDDEDETFIEKYFQSFTSGMIDDINPMSYYPFLKDVYSLFQGYDVERADMSVIADLRDALKKAISLIGKDTSGMDDDELAKHYKTVNSAILSLLDAGCSVFGVPLKNVRRDANGIINAWNTVGKDLTERDTSWNSFWDKVGAAAKDTIPIYAWTKDEPKQDKLYDAIVSGDKAYLARLKSTYKTDSAYQSAVRKALRENDSRIHEAAQAKYEGKTEEYKRIFHQIQKEGKFSFDDIMSAINSEEAAIRNKLEPDKATSSYTASDFVESIVLGDSKSAEAMKEDIIATKVANGKTQAEAEKEFISSVATGIRDAYSSGLLDEAGAEKMLMEYADKDEEEATSKVGYWGFCEDNPKYDYFTESNVKDYREFAEPENISLEVYAQFINGTKGLADIKDKWGDVEVTKREQVLEVIDSLPLTWQQKDALYLAAGYSESKIWDVPW